jgi:hypothetical protein
MSARCFTIIDRRESIPDPRDGRDAVRARAGPLGEARRFGRPEIPWDQSSVDKAVNSPVRPPCFGWPGGPRRIDNPHCQNAQRAERVSPAGVLAEGEELSSNPLCPDFNGLRTTRIAVPGESSAWCRGRQQRQTGGAGPARQSSIRTSKQGDNTTWWCAVTRRCHLPERNSQSISTQSETSGPFCPSVPQRGAGWPLSS